jgi:hypothetical protein
MSFRLSTLAVVVLLVVSGCLAPITDETGPSDVPLPGESSSATSTDRTGEAATSTDGNPWGEDPIVVAIENTGEPGRDFAPLVREATTYWEENAKQYTGFNTSYRVVPDAENPDIVVRFVADVPNCNNVTHAAGCAPRVTDSRQIQRPENVSIRAGLSDESTVMVLKHEFGHTLGLDHQDAPQSVMTASSILYTEPQPNASERDFPWGDSEFTVYVDADNASDPDGAREQVRHAFEYFAEGADGSVPSNLTFEYVDSPEDADVTIRFASGSACGGGSGSCAITSGPDPDGDRAIEQYERLDITLVELDTAAVAWHVGNWFAYGLGAEEQSEKPEPFRGASYSERRTAWWE